MSHSAQVQLRLLAAAACCASALGGIAGSAAALEGRIPGGRTPLGSSPSYQRAIALDLEGRYREALAYYDEAARERSGGRARYHRKLTRGMLTHLEHIRRFPQDGKAHFSLGVDAANKLTALVRETGVVVRAFYTVAEEALRKATVLLPSTNDPAICLAGLYADARERAKARQVLQLIRGRSLNSGEVYNLACYYHSMGQYEEALAELIKVMNPHYRGWIRESDDFYRLRGDPRLEAMLVGPTERVLP